MTLKDRQQWLTVAALAAVALLVLDRIILSPGIDAWKERSSRIQVLEQNIQKGALLIDRDQIIRQQWQTMKAELLPANPSVAQNGMLKALDRWSRASAISVSGITPQPKETEGGYLTVECRADAFGSLNAIARFLYEIERDPLPVRIDLIEITSRDDQGRELSLALRLSGMLLPSKTE